MPSKVESLMDHYNDWPNTQGFDVRYQERSPTELEIIGTIPAYCSGVLFRNGLGPREIQTDKKTAFKVNHWFDCLAQVHRFQIHAPDSEHPNGRVTHNSRLTCDGLIEKIKMTGDRSGLTFGAKYDPCVSIFQKLQSVFKTTPKEQPNDVSVMVTLSANFPGLSREGERMERGHEPGKINTLCNKIDSPTIQMLDPETLEPIGIADQKVLHPSLKGPLSGSHAKTDPVSGDVYNYNLEIAKTGTYRVFHVSAETGKTSILAYIKHPPAYIHSIFLTEHYVILCVWNSYFTAGGASILWTKNIHEALADYDASKPATWFVVDRKPVEEGGRGLVATYTSDPFFAFHTINAYEEPSSGISSTSDIIADVCVYESLDVLKRLYIDNMLSNSPSAKLFNDSSNNRCHAVYRRFRLPELPKSPNQVPLQAVTELKSSSGPGPELPSINPLVRTRRHRYIYGVTDTGKSTFFDGLVKYDIESQENLIWSEQGQTAGEPIFVVDPEGNDEDSGVLLTVVLDGIGGKSYLLILDAKTMKEIGRANVGGLIGFGFHGTHFSDNITGAIKASSD